MGYWFINNESLLLDKHTESPPAQMVNGRQLFRLSGYLDGISPRSFFFRVLYTNSEVFPPAFLLTSLSLSKLPAGSGWLWLWVLPVLSKPLQDQFGLFAAGGGQGFYLQASLDLIWQFCSRYTSALFFSFAAVFLDAVQLRVSCSLFTVQKDHFPPLL